MTSARHRRLLLGTLALLAPLPLPFNEPRPDGVIGFPVLFVYSAATAFFVVRCFQGRAPMLRAAAMNLLGLAYLPFLVADVSVLWQGTLVRPMMHLALFALVAKLYGMQRERDAWHALIGVFFVFLTAMATSTHPAIVGYLLVFPFFALLLLTRFVYFHLDQQHQWPGRLIFGPRSIKRFALATTLAAGLLALPGYVLLPRLRSPYLLGRGEALSNSVAGWNDEVTLDLIGTIRSNRDIALRARFEGAEPLDQELRFKGATYDRYRGATWGESEWRRQLVARRGTFTLASGEPRGRVAIELNPLRSAIVFLPAEALDLSIDRASLRQDDGGAVTMLDLPQQPIEYRVTLGKGPTGLGRPPATSVASERTLDLAYVTPRIAELAAQVAGDGEPLAQARAIEQHLLVHYQYTLDLLKRRAEHPIEDFLFQYRSGHCEYFASAMVLLLRARGIPARFVTGFLGAEYNPIESLYVVRQSNAHAWVEAWLPDRGWQTFDPTPPDGRPSLANPSVALLLRQAYDFVLYRWDRYVIAFSASDQATLLGRLRRAAHAAWRTARHLGSGRTVGSAGGLRLPPRVERATALLVFGSTVALIVGAAWWTRPRTTGRRAYLRLRQLASRRGVALEPSTPPLQLAERLERAWPGAEGRVARLVELYLRESFRTDVLSPGERHELETIVVALRVPAR